MGLARDGLGWRVNMGIITNDGRTLKKQQTLPFE
jgi:hypothetical protein